MEKLVKIIPPSVITFITTFKCTAKCANCCFQCSPKYIKKMSFNEMKTYLDKCLEVYGDTLKLLVLTGGECFLLLNDIKKIIKYATTKGLITRIVTNAYWAKSYKTAFKMLNEFKGYGLKEINFSSGDDHQKWVSFENVRNAAVAAADLDLPSIINIETHDDSNFNIFDTLNKDKILADYVKEDKILIDSGIWMSYSEKSSSLKYTKTFFYDKVQGCRELFSNIPINPYGEILACCGLMAERNKVLRLGNINKYSIKDIYESSFDDIIKIWLYTNGPFDILSYLYKIRNIDIKKSCVHTCDLCRKIFEETKNIEILRNEYKKYSTGVLLHYDLLTKQQK